MSNNILIFCETDNGKLTKSAYEVATIGRKIAGELNGELISAVINCPSEEVEKLADYGINKTILVNDDKLQNYTTEGYSSVLKEIANKENPKAILMIATLLGKDLSPRLAAKLDVDLISDVVDIKWEDDSLMAKRPVFAGKAFVTVKSKHNPGFATIRQNIFKPVIVKGTDMDIEEKAPEKELDIKAVVNEIIRESADALDVAEADIVVSGGRALKGSDNFKMLKELSDLLGAAIGASRAAVDSGWIDHSHQVGQTGKVVTPTLYIACGISGAIQHLAGMRSSKYIVAINKDPEAPIFKIADYGIVGDIFEVVPAMIEELKKIL